jgi:hypothetical protein
MGSIPSILRRNTFEGLITIGYVSLTRLLKFQLLK